MGPRAPADSTAAFLAASGLMVAHQVAGKAVRDGLFLSLFPPSDLPKIVLASAAASILLGLAFAQLMSRRGPAPLVAWAFAAGGAMHLAEYAALAGAGERLRAAVVTLVYVHLVAFGAVLLSGFWSVVNESFDPREAKRRFGRIAGAGTAGGIVGGILAERGSAWFGVDALLLLLGILHLAAAVSLWRVPAGVTRPRRAQEPEPLWQAARDAVRHAPFLTGLALLVLLGTLSAAMLDYLFKSSASAQFGKGPALTRYFAIFYTANQVLAFLAQTFLTPIVLRRAGLGKTVRWHPLMVACGAGASLVGPQVVMAPIARGLELVLRGSFLRSGYELFFTPVPPREKRAVKILLDVGCDRMGDALGAGLLQLLLLLEPAAAVQPILAVTILFALVSTAIASRMDAAYMSVLQHGLLSRAVAIDEADVQDSTTLAALMHTVAISVPKASEVESPQASAPAAATGDPGLARLAELRSGSPKRVAAALHPSLPYDPILVPQAIRLLAWNEALEWARAFLLLHAHRAIGQLVDALIDRDQDFAVRRRIPRILAYTSSQRAVDGLMLALDDARFEIRYHSARALEFLHRMDADLRFDRDAVLAVVAREVAIPRSQWDSRKLIDTEDSDDRFSFLDDLLRDRAGKSLEHVFSLLALVLPGEPVRVAFRALHSDDRMLHGLGVEYLASHLSESIATQLAGLAGAARPVARPAHEVVEQLMASQQSIAASLRSPSAGARG